MEQRQVEAFCRGVGCPNFSDVIARTINAFDRAMEFPRSEHRSLIATWTLATYFHRVFLTFPRLSLSGERESGKSKVLALLQATAWNAINMVSPTPAILFRLAKEFRPTLLLDEVEGLGKDDHHEILSIINSGYKVGTNVPRCEGKDYRVESYQVYCPMALAAIRSPNATTEDRCIPVLLQRGSDRDRLNNEVDPGDPEFARIRDGCYQLLLTRWLDVKTAYLQVPLPSWLNARARELWLPLLAIAGCADAETGLGITDDLVALAMEHVKDRPGISVDGDALLATLRDQLGSAGVVEVRPGDLRQPVGERLGWRDWPTSEHIAKVLKRLGFSRTRKDSRGAIYEITRVQLDATGSLYTPPTTVTPSPSHANPAISLLE